MIVTHNLSPIKVRHLELRFEKLYTYSDGLVDEIRVEVCLINHNTKDVQRSTLLLAAFAKRWRTHAIRRMTDWEDDMLTPSLIIRHRYNYRDGRNW